MEHSTHDETKNGSSEDKDRNWMYPDNVKRQKRAEDLVLMIGEFQDTVKRDRNVMLQEETLLLPSLNKLATHSGFPTVDAFVEHSLSILTAEEKAEFKRVRDAMVSQESSLGYSAQAGGVLGGLATAAGIGVVTVKMFLMNKVMVVMSMRGLAEGITKMISGAITAGLRLIDTSMDGLKLAFKTAGAGQAATPALKFFKAAGKFLTVAAIVLEIATWIAQGIIGDQQRTKFREMINEYCARRFSAYGTLLKVDKIKGFKSSVNTIIEMQKDYLVENEEAIAEGEEIYWTEAKIKKQLKKKFDELQPKLTEAMMLVDNAAVATALAQRDTAGSQWTNEDPNVAQMVQWIADNTTLPTVDPAKSASEKVPEDSPADFTPVPWNWNPQGITADQIKPFDASALDFHRKM